MALIAVVCPHCQSESAVVKNGKSAEGMLRVSTRTVIAELKKS